MKKPLYGVIYLLKRKDIRTKLFISWIIVRYQATLFSFKSSIKSSNFFSEFLLGSWILGLGCPKNLDSAGWTCLGCAVLAGVVTGEGGSFVKISPQQSLYPDRYW